MKDDGLNIERKYNTNSDKVLGERGRTGREM
jgi:hypothetical protein